MREIRVAEAVFLIVAVIECRLQLAFRGGQVILDTYCTVHPRGGHAVDVADACQLTVAVILGTQVPT